MQLQAESIGISLEWDHHQPEVQYESEKDTYSSLFNGEQYLLLSEDPTSSLPWYPSPDFECDGERPAMLASSLVEVPLKNANDIEESEKMGSGQIIFSSPYRTYEAL